VILITPSIEQLGGKMGAWICGMIAVMAFGGGYGLRWLQSDRGGSSDDTPEPDAVVDSRMAIGRAWRDFCGQGAGR
jgi:hypothetical protein